MIDPRISLAVQAPRVGQAINLFNQALQQNRQQQLLPGALDLQQQQIQQTQQSTINLQNQQDKQDLQSIAQFSILNEDAVTKAEGGDTLDLQVALANRGKDLLNQGRDASQTFEALQMIQQGNSQGAVRALKNAELLAQRSGLLGQSQLTAGQRELRQKTEILKGVEFDQTGNVINPETLTNEQRLVLKQEGFTPRATISAQERIATSPELTEQVAESQAQIAGKIEEGKLGAKVKLEPQLQAKIDNVKALVKDAADQRVKSKSNQSAFEVYQVGINNLSEALGQTATGFFSGLSPAFTSSQQAADGALAAMAPILKQMFRSAGEGNFSDQDQKMLLAMIPSRSTSEAARNQQLKAIDDIVRAKLQIEQDQQVQQEAQQPQVLRFDAQGNLIQ